MGGFFSSTEREKAAADGRSHRSSEGGATFGSADGRGRAHQRQRLSSRRQKLGAAVLSHMGGKSLLELLAAAGKGCRAGRTT